MKCLTNRDFKISPWKATEVLSLCRFSVIQVMEVLRAWEKKATGLRWACKDVLPLIHSSIQNKRWRVPGSPLVRVVPFEGCPEGHLAPDEPIDHMIGWGPTVVSPLTPCDENNPSFFYTLAHVLSHMISSRSATPQDHRVQVFSFFKLLKQPRHFAPVFK